MIVLELIMTRILRQMVVFDNVAAKETAAGVLWFPKSSVMGRKPNVACIVKITDKRGNFLGYGLCSPNSKIYIRMITKRDREINKEYWRQVIAEAERKRRPLIEITNSYRVVHAEADGIPAVVIDKYDDVYALQTSSEGSELIKSDIVDIIKDEFKPTSIIEKNAVPSRKKEGLKETEGFLFGSKRVASVREGGQRFEVDILSGQKTGGYLDYRPIRLEARNCAKGRVLDLFCYQGWFTCHAANRGDCVIGVDVSREAIKGAEKNALINGHRNIEFICADAFDYVDTLQEKFDFIHMDPPPFAKSRNEVFSARRGYEKLLKKGLKLINPGGIIMISSCSHHITERILEEVVLNSASGKEIKIIERISQDIDHPRRKGFPQAFYLHAIAFKCIN